MLHTKYQGSRPCGFRQEDFKALIPRICFNSFDLVMQWIEAILIIIKEGHTKIIPTKFGQNLDSCSGGDDL